MNRIALRVEVNLDPVMGTFDCAEDFQRHIQQMLNNAMPWYKPTVLIINETANPLLD